MKTPLTTSSCMMMVSSWIFTGPFGVKFRGIFVVTTGTGYGFLCSLLIPYVDHCAAICTVLIFFFSMRLHSLDCISIHKTVYLIAVEPKIVPNKYRTNYKMRERSRKVSFAYGHDIVIPRDIPKNACYTVIISLFSWGGILLLLLPIRRSVFGLLGVLLKQISSLLSWGCIPLRLLLPTG
jgi:hypothetical protein